MKLTIEQEALVRGLNIAGRAVASRSTLPVLTHVLLTAEEGRLRMTATNLEQAAHAWIDAEVQELPAVDLKCIKVGQSVPKHTGLQG